MQQNIIVERHYPTAKAASTCLCAAKNPPPNKVAGTHSPYPDSHRVLGPQTYLGRRIENTHIGMRRYPTGQKAGLTCA